MSGSLYDFSIEKLGEAKIKSPIRMSAKTVNGVADYVSDSDRILYDIESEIVDGKVMPVHADTLELAGPREKV